MDYTRIKRVGSEVYYQHCESQCLLYNTEGSILIKDYSVDICETTLPSFEVSNENAARANKASYQ